MFSEQKSLRFPLYLVGVIVIFAAVYSQYVIHYGRVLGFIVVYGLPILVVSLIFGKELLRKANRNPNKAWTLGLGLFGGFTVLGLFLSLAALVLILFFDPKSASLLMRPNPVLQLPPGLAWVMVVVSILVVGPAEEYLFRGFIYGGLLSVFKGRHWISLAIVSSLMFTAAHLYYAVTYGVASALPFIDLTTFGLAMAMTYYLSGGNIVIPAIIHGIYDATAFIGVATNMTLGGLLRISFILVGVVYAAVYIRRKTFQTGNQFSRKNENAPQHVMPQG
jgi:membrane protease YdiL (CAAX protease family)